MFVLRAPLIVLALALLGILNLRAEPMTLDTYEAKLDNSQRAQQKGGSFGGMTNEKEFHDMQSRFDPKSFDAWVETLKRVKPGMTFGEVKAILKPRRISIIMAGVPFVWCVLDDAYCVSGVFRGGPETSDDWTLQSINPSPLAITYQVLRPENVNAQAGNTGINK